MNTSSVNSGNTPIPSTCLLYTSWELRDIGIIGVGLLLSVLALTQTGIALPLVVTAVFAFLTIRHEGTSILDFIRYAAAFLLTKQQYYEWRLDP